jgi:tetratricopeptide (TPR) repeat protein
VRSAITDADLFLSYNLPDKAIVPLLGALPTAPRDVRLNQRLAALHTRAERFREAAVCCRTLEGVYSEAGYADDAMRYGELAGRYEELAPASELESAISATTAPAAIWPLTPPDAPEHAGPAPAAEAKRSSAAQPEFAVSTTAAHAEQEAVDLSSEWDDSVTVEAASAAVTHEAQAAEEPARPAIDDPANNAEIAEILEEAHFYLEHSMADQARAALARLEALTSDSHVLDPLRAQIEAASGQPSPEAEQVTIEEPEAFHIEVEPHAAEAHAQAESLVGYHEPIESDFARVAHPEPAPEIHEPVIAAYEVHEPELHVPEVHEEVHEEVQEAAHAETHGEIHEEARAEVHAEAHEAPEAQPVHAQQDAGTHSDLAAFVADLESSLGDAFPEAAPSAPSSAALPAWPVAAASKTPAVEPAVPAPPLAAAASAAATTASTASLSYGPAPVRPLGAGAQAMVPANSVDLSEMFGELKQELEETTGPGDEDPETHYNLGVAFREMGLLDEAIAELQKVCNAVERGHSFSQLVQTYTWLAQCFLDKGVPDAAIRWYEKALTIPNLDTEARTAIHYELGAACETAHDKAAALNHFTRVYGANIDYRDVSERIQALKS